MNPKVDFFFTKSSKWQQEFALLRSFALETALVEELKWGCPCYTLDGKNIFLIHGFKDYCAILFMKGALMKDGKKLLIQQTENVQSARQFRFENILQITKSEKIIKRYFAEAIQIEKEGIKLPPKQIQELPFEEELVIYLAQNPRFKEAFLSLTPGRQRGYNLFIAAAKQTATKTARIKKYETKILAGMGLND